MRHVHVPCLAAVALGLLAAAGLLAQEAPTSGPPRAAFQALLTVSSDPAFFPIEAESIPLLVQGAPYVWPPDYRMHVQFVLSQTRSQVSVVLMFQQTGKGPAPDDAGRAELLRATGDRLQGLLNEMATARRSVAHEQVAQCERGVAEAERAAGSPAA